MYRLIISEKGRDPYGRSLEILGSYNPHSKELQAKAERIKYWIGKGSQMSPTVNNLLIDKGIIQGEKVKASKAGKKPEEAKPAEASQTAAPAPAPKTEEKTEVSQ
jgi:small subunit ribosomal protein S16